MRTDEYAARGSLVRAPEHRADCIDFYHDPTDDARIDFRGPHEIIDAIEDAAERAGRTCNAQLTHVLYICRGKERPSGDDRRTARDWQSLMTQLEMSLDEGENWIPCCVLFRDSQASGHA